MYQDVQHFLLKLRSGKRRTDAGAFLNPNSRRILVPHLGQKMTLRGFLVWCCPGDLDTVRKHLSRQSAHPLAFFEYCQRLLIRRGYQMLCVPVEPEQLTTLLTVEKFAFR